MNESVKVAKPTAIPEAEIYPVEAFISPEYARAEADKLWPRVWQQACRIEELKDVGDFVVYDIMHDTILITRSDEETISAFYNVCAHRGRRLADGCGRAAQFRCKYHAWRVQSSKGENIRVLDREDWKGALCPGPAQPAAGPGRGHGAAGCGSIRIPIACHSANISSRSRRCSIRSSPR